MQLTQSDLQSVLQETVVLLRVQHVDKGLNRTTEFATASLALKEVLQAPLKKTPQAVVRVSDQYLPMVDSNQGF